MPEETPELPVSEQETQIQPPASPSEASSEGGSFLDKLKIHEFKILGGVLGVLVFIGAVFGAYKFGQRQVQPPGLVVTPTPLPSEAPAKEGDPTANWKTYTNTKYKFSFKFPPDWIEAGYVEDDFRAFKQVASKNLEEKGVIPYDYILVSAGLLKKVNQEGFWNKQADETYFNYLYSQKIGEKRKGDPRYTITKLEELLINGAKAVKQAEEVAPEAETEYFYTVSVYILKNGQVFDFSGRFPNQDTWIKTENTLNLMLSTFKFLEESDEVQIKKVLDEYIPEHSLIKVFELEGLKILGNFAKVTVVPKDVVTDKALIILEKIEGQWTAIWGPGTAIGKTDPVLEKIPEGLLD